MSWLSCWDDHEAKPWICRSFCDRFPTMSDHVTTKQQIGTGISKWRLYPWWLQEVVATCWAQSQTETKLKRNLFSVRHHGTTDHGVETIQFWDPILTTRWPWRSWAAHFWSQDAPLQGTFGPESAFGHFGKLTPETTLSSRGDLCLMGRQTNTRKSCCSMGFKQEIMGIQSAKIKETRELIAAAGQCSWQNSPFQIHDQTMSKATTGVTWSCYALRLKGKTATFIKFNYGPCASPKWSIAMSIHNTVLKIITGARAV